MRLHATTVDGDHRRGLECFVFVAGQELPVPAAVVEVLTGAREVVGSAAGSQGQFSRILSLRFRVSTVSRRWGVSIPMAGGGQRGTFLMGLSQRRLGAESV